MLAMFASVISRGAPPSLIAAFSAGSPNESQPIGRERPWGSCRGAAAFASCATREAAPSRWTLASRSSRQEVRDGRIYEAEPEGRRGGPGAEVRARGQDRVPDGPRRARARAVRPQLPAPCPQLPLALRAHAQDA